MLAAARVGGAGRARGQPVGSPRRGGARVRHEAPHGRADYLLFVDGTAAGVIEAKKGGTLIGVEWQSAKYDDGLPDEIPTAIDGALPFVYESTGVETRFTNTLDPDPASRARVLVPPPGDARRLARRDRAGTRRRRRCVTGSARCRRPR